MILSISSVAFAIVALVIAVIIGCFGNDSAENVNDKNVNVQRNEETTKDETEENIDFNIQTNQGRKIVIEK